MKKYDLHLSAKQISKKTILAVEKLGFTRDTFANNRHCDITVYHGTYRGNILLPNKNLWDSVCLLLKNDFCFEGTLEEEQYDTNRIFYFDNTTILPVEKPKLPEFVTIQPSFGMYKACDIHIGIDINESDNACIEALETLAIASFDKPKKDSVYRIYTITTERLIDGYQICNFLKNYFSDGFTIKGKIKAEKTIQYFRKPSSVNTLPIVTKKEVKNWFKKLTIAV